MNTAWIFAGGAAVTGLLATCWTYVRSFYQYLMSWLIISVTVQGYHLYGPSGQAVRTGGAVKIFDFFATAFCEC